MTVARVNGADVYYEAKGEGEPLLLLPGLGRGTSYFDVIEPILRREFRTIVVDPRGIGRSSKENRLITAEEWADDFAALLTDHLGITAAHVLGSSHGGSMAMAMALRHPAQVASLLLFGAFSELDRFIVLNMDLRIRLAHKLGMDVDLRDFISLWTFGHEGLEKPGVEKFLDAQLAAVRQHTPESYSNICKSLLHWGRKLPGQESQPVVTSLLHRIKCPTLVVYPGAETVGSTHNYDAMRARIPDVEVIAYEGLPHNICDSVPDRCADDVLKFLAKRFPAG
ncbi:MAG TPA: alpha/beta hydrolase [Burkholderiales bacterium]